MFILGLTGGIGSGKSAVSDRFEALDITVVDADKVARLVVEPGTEALRRIEEHFGQQVLAANGSLDRAYLRQVIFADNKERQWLESITHPAIGTEIAAQIKKSLSLYTIFVSPLLMETQQHQLTHRILVVDVPVEIQIERTVSRDHNSAAQVEAIIAAQISRTDRLQRADDIISNTKDLAWLDEEVSRLHEKYLHMATEFDAL